MHWNPETFNFAALIPIVAILGGFVIAGIAIITDYQRKRAILELYHKERLAAIERGMTPPMPPSDAYSDPVLDAALRHHPSRHALIYHTRRSPLRRGIVWLLVGSALFVALYLNRDLAAASWALVPIALGIGNLIFHFLSPTAPQIPREDLPRGPTPPGSNV